MEIRKHLSNLKWNAIFYSKYFTDNCFRQAMINNKTYFDRHSGETCFIIGNGPSIKSEDLSKLSDKFVFTVNNIYKNNGIFKLLNSNVHTFVDPAYARLSENEFNDLLKNIKSEEGDRICLCSSDCIKYDFIFRNNQLTPVYLFMHRNWREKLNNINISRNVYTVQNVVQAAILFALAMGFKTIYLLGCEMTSFLENLEFNANGILIQNHAYIMDDSIYKKNKSEKDNTYMLTDYSITFQIFKKLNLLARNYQAEIINLTRGGILDMFKRDELCNI